MIRALIFDFDGLILDTEGPDYRAWLEIFREHGHELPFDLWSGVIGRAGDYFDAVEHLEGQLGQSLDRDAIRKRHKTRHLELIEEEAVLPGVLEYLDEARRLGLKLAIASSASRVWLTDHLSRLGLEEHWQTIHSRDEVARAKPDPDLYLAALRALGVEPEEAIALEDSPNGVKAARAAGIFCVAVPNPLTARLDLSEANLQLSSLQDMSLTDIIARAEAQHIG
jgi:HAD superfamily hydrolase (TIGR01509 family)